MALAECCFFGGIGFRGGWKIRGRLDAALYGEMPSRFVVSVAPARVAGLKREATRHGIGVRRLGSVGGKRFTVEGLIDVGLERARGMWHDGLERMLREASKGRDSGGVT